MTANPVTCLIEGNGSLAGRDRSGAFSAIGSGALRYAPAPGARVNYVPTPLTGNSVATWYAAGVTLTPSTDWVSSGTHSGKIVVTAVGPSTGIFTPFTQIPGFIRHLPGRPYNLSVKVYNPQLTPRTIRTFWRAYDLAGNAKAILDTFRSTTIPAQSSVTVTAIATMPGDAGGSYIVVYADNSTVNPFINGDVLYVTDARISDGAVDLGAISNPVWLDPITGVLGTADASPSVSRAQLWIEEATTNLCTNPSFEVNTTGWSAYDGASVISRVTTRAYIGAASLMAVTDASTATQGTNFAVGGLSIAAAGNLIASFRISGASGSLRANLRVSYSDASADNGGNANITLSGSAWQSVTVPVLAANPAKTVTGIQIYIVTTSAQTLTFYVDAVQIEQKAYATSYCLDPDTIVATPSGVARLGDVSVGDGLIGQDRVNSVIAAWPVETEAYELSLDNGVKIVASAEHRFMVSKCPFDERRGRSGGWRFRELGDLINGDYVQLSTKVNAIEGADEPDMAYVLGYLLGDGYAKSATKRGQTMVQFSFGLDAAALAERVRDSFVACMPTSVYHGHHPKIQPSGSRELFLTSQNRDVYNEFASRGFPVDCGAQDKTLPECVWTYKQSDLLAFLAGLIDSDGTVDKNLNLAICSSSKQLIVDLQRLCAMRLGVNGWLQSEEGVSTGFAEHRNLYRLRFKIADGAALYEMGLPLKHERKAERLRQCVTRDVSGLEYVEGRRRFARIVGIVPVGKRTLIDITLDPDHDFIAEGAVTHNCDGSLGTGYTWAGTAHASASTRAAANVAATAANHLDIETGSVVSRFSLDYLSGNWQGIFAAGSQDIPDFLGLLRRDTGQFIFKSQGGSQQSSDTFTPLADQRAYAEWDDTALAAQLDANTEITGTRDAVSGGLSSANAYVGCSNNGNELDGRIGPVAIYDRPLSDTERLMVNNAIDSNGTINLWGVIGGNPYTFFQLRPY